MQKQTQSTEDLMRWVSSSNTFKRVVIRFLLASCHCYSPRNWDGGAGCRGLFRKAEVREAVKIAVPLLFLLSSPLLFPIAISTTVPMTISSDRPPKWHWQSFEP